jgi:hypothetical protein
VGTGLLQGQVFLVWAAHHLWVAEEVRGIQLAAREVHMAVVVVVLWEQPLLELLAQEVEVALQPSNI